MNANPIVATVHKTSFIICAMHFIQKDGSSSLIKLWSYCSCKKFRQLAQYSKDRMNNYRNLAKLDDQFNFGQSFIVDWVAV